MRNLLLLIGAFIVSSSYANCPLPTPDSLSEVIEAAKEETHKFRYDEGQLAPKLNNLSVQKLAHYMTDLAKGGTPAGYDKALVLAFEAASKKGDTALLKYALDYDGDGYSVVRILAHDVDDQNLVAEVVQSFTPQTGQSSVGTKLLSDVDDTIYANLVDPRYEKTNKRYPGVEALYRAIAEEPESIKANWSGSLSLVTLSARPAIRGFDLIKPGLSSVSNRLDGICAMSLGGEIVSSSLGTVFTLQNQASTPIEDEYQKYEKIGSKMTPTSDEVSFLSQQETKIGRLKFDNFRRFSKIYPDYDYVFFGDSGQADAYAAQLIMEYNSKLPGPGKAIVTFIHDLRVSGEDGDWRGMSPTKVVHDAVKHDDVILFRNHIQAALIAYRRGNAGTMKKLVDAEELVAVVNQALAELTTVQFKTDEIGTVVKAGFAQDAAEAMVEAKSARALTLTSTILNTVAQACRASQASCVTF